MTTPVSGYAALSATDPAAPFGDSKFTARNWDTLDALKTVAAEVGRLPASVALAWAAGRPGITSPIIGASRVAQALNKASAVPSAYDYFAPEVAFGMPVQAEK